MKASLEAYFHWGPEIFLFSFNAGGKPEQPGKNLWKEVWTGNQLHHTALVLSMLLAHSIQPISLPLSLDSSSTSWLSTTSQTQFNKHDTKRKKERNRAFHANTRLMNSTYFMLACSKGSSSTSWVQTTSFISCWIMCILHSTNHIKCVCPSGPYQNT